MIIISDIGDVRRFKSAKALTAYAGFDPSLKVSAGKVTSHTVRKGNKFLHTQVMYCANSLLTHRSEEFGVWGHRIKMKQSKGGFKKASAAISRKILTSIYYMWLRREKFTYQHYNLNEKFAVEDDFDLSKIGLTTRTLNLLKRESIDDVNELIDRYYSGTLFKYGFGLKTIQEIEECLLQLKKQTRRKKLIMKKVVPTVKKV